MTRPPHLLELARIGAILSAVMAGAGCGVAVAPLEAFDVVITPLEDCTLTGATSRDCEDTAVLAAQRTRGRWIFEHGSDRSFTLTPESGLTLPGIYFNDDGRETAVEPTCAGGGGLCYFARRRVESTDLDDNGCIRASELVVILRRVEDGTIDGVLSDRQAASESCGTSTQAERIDGIAGTEADAAALARAEAAP